MAFKQIDTSKILRNIQSIKKMIPKFWESSLHNSHRFFYYVLDKGDSLNTFPTFFDSFDLLPSVMICHYDRLTFAYY